MTQGENRPASGMAGVMRMVAIIAVLAAAAFGLLVVFDVLSREQIADYATRTFIGVAIIAAAAFAIGFIGRRGS